MRFRRVDGGIDAIGELVACAYRVASIEDGKAMRRVLLFALVFRFGKPAIIIVLIEVVVLAAYLVGYLAGYVVPQ